MAYEQLGKPKISWERIDKQLPSLCYILCTQQIQEGRFMLFDLIGKSAAEKAKDKEFLDALKQINTLVVKDGRMSMDFSDLEDKVRTSRQQAKKLMQRS